MCAGITELSKYPPVTPYLFLLLPFSSFPFLSTDAELSEITDRVEIFVNGPLRARGERARESQYLLSFYHSPIFYLFLILPSHSFHFLAIGKEPS